MLFGISCSENKTNLTAQEFQSFALDPLNLLSISCIKRKCHIARFFPMYKDLKRHFKVLLDYYSSLKDKVASPGAQEIFLVLIFLPTH